MTFRVRLVMALSLVVWLVLPPPARAQDGICTSQVPPNIDAGMLASHIVEILARSETFRQQCQRIAAARLLRVKLGLALHPAGDYRATTLLYRYDTGSLRAEVSLVFAENYVELIAHEFEHVLEQVDGVDLRSALPGGEAKLLPGGVFETRRATAAGRQVLREYETLASSAGRRRYLWFR
jgi:hypothetical protein